MQMVEKHFWMKKNLHGIATDEYGFRDEFFTDAALHRHDGKNIMLPGLDVLPEYCRKGLGREQENGRNEVFLTCLQEKVQMYKKFGFVEQGIANSTRGGGERHEMSWTLGV